MPKNKDLVHIIREGIRETIHQTIHSVVQEATEEELRIALREESVKGSLTELIRTELRMAIESLRTQNRSRGK